MLSEVPEGWQKKQVEDVCEILDKFRVPLNSQERSSRKGTIPYWGANGIVDYVDEAIFDEPLLLMPEDGGAFSESSFKPICFKIDEPVWVNNHAHVLRVTQANREYVYQWFVNRDITDFVVGGTRTKLNQKALRSLPVLLPPINEQHRIAEILTSVDASIQATQAVIEQAVRVKLGLMEELLTGGLGSVAIEHGEVPTGWELCRLADKAKFTNGKAHEKDIDEDGNYIVVNSKFISSEGSVAKKTNSAKCPAEKNDILMVMSDVPKGKAIAKCFYVDRDDCYTVNQRICRLSAQEIEPLFLFYVLNRNRYFLAFDDGVKQTNLRKAEVLECPIAVPPVEYQHRVIKILETFTAKISLDYKQLNRLKTVKRGLMDDLLTGKVGTV